MNTLKRYILGALFLFAIASPLLTVVSPQTVQAAPCSDARLFGIPPWYRGLTKTEGNSCSIVSPNDVGGLESFIWRIVLNVVEIVLVLTAYVAFLFIIWGGFQFITGGGNASKIESARKTLLNAIIGLVISLGAVAITTFVFGIFGDLETAGNGVEVVKISDAELLGNILNLVYFVIGVVTVITIIVAGLNYATSGGDAARTGKAKNMILYAVIGLVIAISASVITNFVVGRF